MHILVQEKRLRVGWLFFFLWYYRRIEMLILRHEFNLPLVELCDAFVLSPEGQTSCARLPCSLLTEGLRFLSSAVKALC